jgi:hypothetical protein
MAQLKPFGDFKAYQHNKAKQYDNMMKWLVLVPLAIVATFLFLHQPAL